MISNLRKYWLKANKQLAQPQRKKKKLDLSRKRRPAKPSLHRNVKKKGRDRKLLIATKPSLNKKEKTRLKLIDRRKNEKMLKRRQQKKRG